MAEEVRLEPVMGPLGDAIDRAARLHNERSNCPGRVLNWIGDELICMHCGHAVVRVTREEDTGG